MHNKKAQRPVDPSTPSLNHQKNQFTYQQQYKAMRSHKTERMKLLTAVPQSRLKTRKKL